MSAPLPGVGRTRFVVAVRASYSTPMKSISLLLLLWIGHAIAAEVAVPAGANSQLPGWSSDALGRPWLSWVEPRDESWVLRGAVAGANGFAEVTDFASGRDWFINWADTPGLALLNGRLTPYGLVYTHEGRGYALWVGQPDRFFHEDRSAVEHGFFSSAAGWGVWLDGQQYGNRPVTQAQSELRARVAGSSEAEVIVDDRVCDCCGTAAVALPDGFLVAYRDRSADEVRDINVVRFRDGVFEAPRRVHADGWVIRGCPVNGPAAARGADRVAIAWFTAADEKPRVRLALAPIESLDFAAPIEVDTAAPLGRVAIAAFGDGFVVVWLRATDDVDGAEIRYARFRADGTRVTEGLVTRSSSRRGSGFPKIAAVDGAIWVAHTDTSRSDGAPRIRVEIIAPESLDDPEAAALVQNNPIVRSITQ